MEEAGTVAISNKPPDISSVRKKSNCSDFQALLWEEFLGGGGGGEVRHEDGEGKLLLECNNSTTTGGGGDTIKDESVIIITSHETTSTKATTDNTVEEASCHCNASSSTILVETDDKVTTDPSDPKVKFNLNKEPIIKLERLPSWVLEKKTVRVTVGKNNKICFLKDGVDDSTTSESSGSEDEEENEHSKIVSEVPAHLNLVVHPLMFSHLNNRSNALYSNPQRCQWAASFFLHMNRYKPEEESSILVSPSNEYMSIPSKSKSKAPTTSNSKSHSPRGRRPYKQRTSSCQIQRHQKDDTRSTAPRKKRKEYPKMRAYGKGKWSCEYCDKTFLYKWNMETHLMLHTGEKPYPCRHINCESRYQQRAQLIVHYAEQHPYSIDAENAQQQQGNEPSKNLLDSDSQQPGVVLNPLFSCGFCGERFEQGKYLKNHILEEHKDKLVRKLQKRALS